MGERDKGGGAPWWGQKNGQVHANGTHRDQQEQREDGGRLVRVDLVRSSVVSDLGNVRDAKDDRRDVAEDVKKGKQTRAAAGDGRPG